MEVFRYLGLGMVLSFFPYFWASFGSVVAISRKYECCTEYYMLPR